MFENDHGSIVQLIPVEELEVLERVDPSTVDKSRFSLVSSKNGPLRQSSSEASQHKKKAK
ncbi:MAG: hypothetical protein Q8Q90_03620 [bacterium]|nr:hypothetical protein [bacterium]